MKSITPWTKALAARLFASLLSIAAAQMWSQTLIGDGVSPTDDPGSPYFHSKVAPPSWQGRPYAIPDDRSALHEGVLD
jgi:hypothetical protein